MKTTVLMALAILLPGIAMADGVGNNTDACVEKMQKEIKESPFFLNLEFGYMIVTDVKQAYDKKAVRDVIVMTYRGDIKFPTGGTLPFAGFALNFADTCEFIDGAGNAVSENL